MKEIKILGIDLAKNIFQLHGVDAAGKPVLRKAVSRRKLMEALVNLPPCQGSAKVFHNPLIRLIPRHFGFTTT